MQAANNELETPKKGSLAGGGKDGRFVSASVPAETEINEVCEVPEENLTYLIFSVGETFFAIKTLLVKEIMHSAKIHPLPFVPEYIEGVVNCHGTPFTVVNTLKMAGEEKSEIKGGTVLVFKRKDDNFGIHISNIEMFFEPEEQDIRVDGIRYKTKIIPFFDSESIEERMKEDLTEKED
ncbi:chemotaxis protein CheW [Treponema zioleckii]|uniref:chemotaxis protein CheW n=1 Tax=Treponema zioleckii TaxID=331680 RepID=UPI00168BB4E7|nr:chemotaxis protein CheW [Treponema zioleckii]